MKLDEVWAQIEEFPDYAISNQGQVKSLRYERLLTPRPNSYGVLRVVLYRDGRPYDRYIHRLVAENFTTGFRPEYKVRHRDGNGFNNHVTNMEFSNNRGLGQMVKQPTEPSLRHIRVPELDMVFRTIRDCARYLNTEHSPIYKVLRGERRSHLGYTFEYIYE